MSQSSNNLNFVDATAVDYGNDFNGAQFISPRTGKYFMTMSGSAAAQHGVVLTPSNVSPALSLVRESTNSVSDVFLSRDAIVSVNAIDQVGLTVSSLSDLYRSIASLTSIGMFNIEDVLVNPDYFFVGNPSPISTNNFMTFSNIYSNSPQFTNNRYTCNRNGPMFLFVSAGISANTGQTVVITQSRNGSARKSFYLSLLDTVHNGNDMVSRSVLIDCAVGDELLLDFPGGGTKHVFSDSSIRTTFGGFHYQPRYGNPVTWALYRTIDHTGVGTNHVIFSEVILNTNDMYSNGETVISVSGYYLIHFSTGSRAGDNVDAEIFNSHPTSSYSIARIYSQGSNHNSDIVLARTVIVYLQSGSRLTMRSTSSIFSFRQQLETSFMGMLLMPQSSNN